MSWFVFALICTFGWGSADLFYKAGTDEKDRYSHLKIAVWVGLVMGISSIVLLVFTDSGVNLLSAIKYLPASLSYIISMIIGYAGLRYLEVSIVSPVQNASGAFSAICILVYYALTGRFYAVGEYSPLAVVATLAIVAGVILLAIIQQRLTDDGKYKYGAMALAFPLLYCLFDTVGTAADGIILGEENGLGEIDVLILYGLTFFVIGAFSWLYMLIKTKKPYKPFEKTELPKMWASVCEEFGQVFYVFAMAKKPVLAAPMISSYCIVSVILSRLLLKEKLKKTQYACVLLVIIGIVILGIEE